MQGRSWEYGAVIVGGDMIPTTQDPFAGAAAAQTPPAGKASAEAAKSSQTTLAAGDSSPELHIRLRMPKPVSWGETASMSLEVVSIKGKAGGSPAELTLDPLPPAVAAAGDAWGTGCLHVASYMHSNTTCVVTVQYAALNSFSCRACGWRQQRCAVHDSMLTDMGSTQSSHRWEEEHKASQPVPHIT